MYKLRLSQIRKSYKTGDESVDALKGVSLEFRENEFVSILGPSGCGKTTLLNVIGGLDHYDSGDLTIKGMSTKQYKDADWDAYRNRSIGFVFQSYNLIAHQTVLQNVEISMTLSGIPAVERKQRAIEALKSVDLTDKIMKKPGQLSGGQMQRVAIARALVNDPDIILADEPTGALDSHTSIQVMEILKEISKTHLVIMVTHNGKLAEEYSDRIIRLLDGEVQSDSNPVEKKDPDNPVQKQTRKKQKMTSMSLATALLLSFKNLLTKKGRTIITAFAGSIGIIGVALVLALSNGLSSYMNSMQSETLSGLPITISTTDQSVNFSNSAMVTENSSENALEKFTDENIIHRYDPSAGATTHANIITQDFLDYIARLETELPNTVNNIAFLRGVNVNLLAKGEDTVVKFDTSTASANMEGMPGAMLTGGTSYWQELPENKDFILSLYDLIGEGSRFPTSENEVVLVVDEYNRLDQEFFEKLGMTTDLETYKLTDFIGKSPLKVVPNDDYYTKNGDIFIPANSSKYNTLFESDSGMKLTITGILRVKEDVSSSYLSSGIAYTSTLTDYIVENAENSVIATAQMDSDVDILSGAPFANDAAREQRLISLGAVTTPTGINIYPTDFAGKNRIKEYLDEYNQGRSEKDQIIYSDLAETITSVTGTLLNTVSYVLIGFAAISLIVSTIMIGIITYVSVIERTKEIGILRSVGARKKDISRVFNAETIIVGFTAGTIGVVLSYILTMPINAIINRLVNISGIAQLNPIHAFFLILGSMALTLIAGLFPSRVAANKDPVIALRTD